MAPLSMVTVSMETRTESSPCASGGASSVISTRAEGVAVGRKDTTLKLNT